MKNIFKITLFFFLLLLAIDVSGRQSNDSSLFLVSNIEIQIEVTEAMNDLYNFKFEKAEKQFYWFKQKYKWHPLPYFLFGLNEWWKIMAYPNNQEFQSKFLSYMDSSILISEGLYDYSEKYHLEAAFFLAAANGFKSRLYADNENWTLATVNGSRSLKYLTECTEGNVLSTEIKFGLGLYNYFAVWIAENYKSLRAVMWFFPDGDKDLGLSQLTEVSYNSFYTRTEAMVWLMRIYHSFENSIDKSIRLANYLRQTYPDNSYFHQYNARLLYSKGQFPKMVEESKSILNRIDSGKVGYGPTSGRYATYFLAHNAERNSDKVEAKKYYELCVGFTLLAKETDSGYYHYSLLNLGEMSVEEGDLEKARDYYLEVRKLTKRKNSVNKAAKKRLKELRRL